MTTLATIAPDQAQLDPRLEAILEASGAEREEFESLDWFGLLPFFALAGASVQTEVHTHGDHFHFGGVRIEVPDEFVEGFLAVLPELLAQLEAPE